MRAGTFTGSRRGRAAALAVLAAASVLTLAACGGGGSKTTASTASTSAPSNVTGSGSSTTQPSFTGSSTSSFCQLASQERKDSVGAAQLEQNSTPAELKALFHKALSVLPSFVSRAPAVLKSDVETLASFVRTFYNDLAADNYDVTKLAANPQMATLFESPQLKSASNAVDGYLTSVCHIGSS